MPAVSDCHRVFVANMAALYRRDPRLAHALDGLPEDQRLAIEPSREGPPTARVALRDGRALFLHSKYDPVGEARKFCEQEPDREALCAVLCGLGLGYHVVELLEDVGPQGAVVIAESDLTTIKSALEVTDLAEPIRHGRVVFITTPEKAEVHEKLNAYAAILMLGTRFVVPPPARQIRPEFHAAVREHLLDFAAFSKMSLVTLVANSRVTCENIAANLPTYLASPSIGMLERRFAGYPAIIVSAGPSLDRNVAQLRDAAGRAVIIAVQTVFKPLLARGVQPDFVTTLDFSDLSRRFFEGVEDFGRTVMVAEPKASWAVVDAFRGGRGPKARPALLLNNEFAQRCVGASLAARAGLSAGSTVAHLSFYLAEYLGCDPIIFIGQDLGFTGGVYYAPGVAIHDAWQPELGRFCSLEQKEWERIVRHRPILRRMTDNNGHPIYTDEQMFTYLEQFERDFAASRARVIDATEGGVRKRGTTAMPLAEAMDQFCQRPLPAEAMAVRESARNYDVGRVEAGRAALSERLGQLAAFRELCEETRKVLEQLVKLVDDPPRFNQLIIRVDELRSRVRDHDLMYRMVTDVSQLAELQKFSADRRLVAQGVTGAERTRRQLQRDERFIGALLEGCDALQRILDLALCRADEELAAKP